MLLTETVAKERQRQKKTSNDMHKIYENYDLCHPTQCDFNQMKGFHHTYALI